MTDRPATADPGSAQAPAIPARLEPDAIGVAQDTIIGLANVGPALSVALTLAGLAAAAAYGAVPVILLCMVPMVIIANSYRRLNLWSANAGASFEWVGRAIDPYLGFFTGWLMLAANILGTTAATVILAPSVLAVFGSNSTSTWPNILISTAVIVVMLVIAIVGGGDEGWPGAGGVGAEDSQHRWGENHPLAAVSPPRMLAASITSR